jgi:hypothetical protein
VSTQRRLPVTGRGTPEVDRLIDSRRGERPAVGTKGDAHDSAAMTGEDMLGSFRSRVPDLRRVIVRSGGDSLAVGADGDGRDDVFVPFQERELPSAGGIPEAGRAVGASRDKRPPVTTECDRPDPRGVSAERSGFARGGSCLK